MAISFTGWSFLAALAAFTARAFSRLAIRVSRIARWRSASSASGEGVGAFARVVRVVRYVLTAGFSLGFRAGRGNT